jgi:hypothetical protein
MLELPDGLVDGARWLRLPGAAPVCPELPPPSPFVRSQAATAVIPTAIASATANFFMLHLLLSLLW